MNEPLFVQLSARERKIIRKSLDPDARFYHKSPQSSPRNHFKKTKDFTTQSSLPKIQDDKEKEINQVNDNESNIENNDNEINNDNNEAGNEKEIKNEAEIKNETKTENTEEKNDNKSTDQEELNENSQDNENTQNNENDSQNKDLTMQSNNGDTLKDQSEEEEEDILSRKLFEASMKHSIQQKILIQEAEVDLRKSNYSPVSLRSFIIKSNNFKQKRQGEIMRIYEKYGSTYKTSKQITQRNRSNSEKKTSNQANRYRSSYGLNLTPRLSMFSTNRISPPNPRFSAPAALDGEQEQNNATGQIRLPPMSQTQQISNHISLFDTQSEKVYHSENSIHSNLNDPFNIILSQQELVSSPSIKLNVKPPPPPAKKAASPRKQDKKKGKTSKMSRKRGKSALSTNSQEPQEPKEPPPPPIKRHVLTMRTSMIPKNGIIDVDKRDFLDFLNDKEEEIEVEVKIEEDQSEADKSSTKSSKGKKSKLSKSSRLSRSKSRSKSKTSSKK